MTKTSKLIKLIGQHIIIEPNDRPDVYGRLIFGTSAKIGKNDNIVEINIEEKHYHGSPSTGWYLLDNKDIHRRFFKSSILDPSDIDTQLNMIHLYSGFPNMHSEKNKLYGIIPFD